MKKIKVNISSDGHSAGRGVGFYSQNLISALKKFKDIVLTGDNPDIIHYPFFDLFYNTLPLKKEKPTVVTIHDLTPFIMPDRYPKGVKGTFNLLRQWYSLRSVSAIITDSENSKKDIEKYFRVTPEKIFVTPLAVSKEYQKKPTAKEMATIKKKYGLPDKFVVTIAGGPNPNKNIPSLAEVTDRLEIPLVVVGKGFLQEIINPVHPELIDLVRLQSYSHVIYPGYVPTEDLNVMLRLASLYAQPSFYEGFGIPVLEAMTAGCLITSSRTSSLPEIYYPEAIVFNPRSLKSMEQAISKALKLSPARKAKHIQMGIDKARQFSWEKTASLTAEVYRKICP